MDFFLFQRKFQRVPKTLPPRLRVDIYIIFINAVNVYGMYINSFTISNYYNDICHVVLCSDVCWQKRKKLTSDTMLKQNSYDHYDHDQSWSDESNTDYWWQRVWS